MITVAFGRGNSPHLHQTRRYISIENLLPDSFFLPASYCEHFSPGDCADGKNALAIGDSGAYNYLIGGQTCDMISSEVKDTLIMLYEREGYTFKFVDFDSDANRPPVVNILTDAQFDYRTGQILD